MKTLAPRVLLATFLLALPVVAQLEPGSEPVSLGPVGGSAVSVVVNPSDNDEILVIKYTQGVFRSTDGGDTFGLSPYGSGTSGTLRGLTQDPSDPDTLYVLGDNHVFRSTDFGATWNPTSLEGLYSSLKSVAVAPTGDTLLATDAFNAYRSGNGGATWSTVLQVVPFSGAVLDSVIFAQSDASVVYIGHTDGLFRSDDGGASFADTGPFDINVNDVTISPTDPDDVFVCSSFDGVARSTDGGVTFSPIGTVAVDDANGRWFTWDSAGGLWYGGLTEVFYTPDSGTSWLEITEGWPVLKPIMSTMVVAENGMRYLGAESNSLFGDQVGGGLYRMPAGAPTVFEHIAFLASPVPDVKIVTPGGLRIMAIGNGVYSGSPGEPPEPTALFLIDTRAVEVDPLDATRWVAGGVGSFFDNAQIHVVSNSGDSFVRTYERFGAGVVTDIDFDPHFGNRLMAGMFPGGFGNAALILSTNSGDSWADVPGTAGWATRAIAFDPHNVGRVLQLSDNNQWSESVNAGSVWLPLQPAWPGTGPAVLLEFDPFVSGRLYRGDTGSGLWRSDDDGANWISLGVGLTAESELLLHPELPGQLWVGDNEGQILVSFDHGSNFLVALDVPQAANGSAMALDTSTGNLLVGTDGASLWELPGASSMVLLGGGTAGINGVPRLTGSGSLLGGSTTTLDLIDAPANALMLAWLSFASSPQSFFGGTIHATPFANQFLFTSDGTGSFSASTTWPNGVLAGTAVWFQFIVQDLSVIHGLTLSNGLRLIAP
jgi:hypothetical protein